MINPAKKRDSGHITGKYNSKRSTSFRFRNKSLQSASYVYSSESLRLSQTLRTISAGRRDSRSWQRDDESGGILLIPHIRIKGERTAAKRNTLRAVCPNVRFNALPSSVSNSRAGKQGAETGSRIKTELHQGASRTSGRTDRNATHSFKI